MGSAVGQVPDYACMITEWVKEVARTPVLVFCGDLPAAADRSR